MLCAHCVSEVESGAPACAHCGTPVPTPQIVAAPVTSAVGDAPISVPTFAPQNELEGIGGWLILVAIGLIFSPLIILGSTVSTNLPLLENPAAQAFLQSHPGIRALIAFEVGSNVIFAVLLIALNYLFFTRRRSFPTYFIFYMILQLGLLSADTVLAHLLIPGAPISAKGAPLSDEA